MPRAKRKVVVRKTKWTRVKKSAGKKTGPRKIEIAKEPSPEPELEPQIIRVRQSEKRKLREDNQPIPDRILQVTTEQYKAAMDYLESPEVPFSNPPLTYCTQNTLMTPVMGDLFECLMSDNFMFQEMTNCLEQGDLDGFLAIETSAFGTRKKIQLKNDLICAALYALFYHPAAKDQEIFQRCLESLFNSKRMRLGSTDQVLRMIMSSFAFEGEVA